MVDNKIIIFFGKFTINEQSVLKFNIKLINEKVKIQKDSIQHYNPDKVQIVEFSSDNF